MANKRGRPHNITRPDERGRPKQRGKRPTFRYGGDDSIPHHTPEKNLRIFPGG
jgi:hypothetical protein